MPRESARGCALARPPGWSGFVDYGDAHKLLTNKLYLRNTVNLQIQRGRIPTENGLTGWLGKYEAALARTLQDISAKGISDGKDPSASKRGRSQLKGSFLHTWAIKERQGKERKWAFASAPGSRLCLCDNYMILPMMISEDLIRQIVQRITSVTTPERIILFGSASTGQMTKDIDIDLLVLERNAQDNRGERLRIRQALKDLGHPFDVIVMATERFEESKNVIGGIAYPANKYGRVVYEIVGRG